MRVGFRTDTGFAACPQETYYVIRIAETYRLYSQQEYVMLELRGSYVALVTPFTQDDQVNYDLLREMVDWHVEQGTDGLVPVGTTGESPTLTYEEHEKVVETVVKAADGRVPVLAGAGSNCTREAVHLTEHAKKIGADGALIVMPYYNKPTQAGMIAHYERLNEVGLPLVIYNIPGRSVVNMEPATFEKLAPLENIVGVKEASGNINQISEIVMRTKGHCAVMSGDDSMTLPLLSVGGTGVISVIANVVPAQMSRMVKAWEEGNASEALELHQKLFFLGKNMLSLETNPGPVKAAMEMCGMPAGHVRLPLANLSDENKAKLRAILKEYDVID